MTTTRRQFVQALGSAAALGALHPLSAFAQALDQVKIMYGFPAGSAGDSVARRVAEKWGGSAFSNLLDNLADGTAEALEKGSYVLPFLILAFPLALLWVWLWRKFVRRRP